MIAIKKFSIIFFSLLCIMQGNAQSNSEKVGGDIDTFKKYLDKDLDSAYYFIHRAYAKSVVLKRLMDNTLLKCNYLFPLRLITFGHL